MSQDLHSTREFVSETEGKYSVELFKEGGINFAEIEAGFSLHAFFQFGRDALLHLGIHVHRHEVVADVVLSHADGGKPNRFALVDRVARYQSIEFGFVGEDFEVFLIRLQHLL